MYTLHSTVVMLLYVHIQHKQQPPAKKIERFKEHTVIIIIIISDERTLNGIDGDRILYSFFCFHILLYL